MTNQFITLIAAAFVAWVVFIVPRARKWIAECDDATNDPIPMWAPPAGMRPLGISFPPFDGVEWSSISHEVDAEGVHVFHSDAVGPGGAAAKRRSPLHVAFFAVQHAKDYLDTGDEKNLLLAARQIEYLAGAAAPVTIGVREGVLWCADLEVGRQYNVTAPWKSAYFQILSMSALTWGYALTGNTRYLDLVRRGLVPLEHATEEGGLCYRTPGGGTFFEEIVSSPPHHILNGHLHTLINLRYLRAFTGWEEVDPIIESALAGTTEVLPLYDRYDYSQYSLAPNPGFRNHFNIANPYYHRLHVALLRQLHSLTGNVTFEKYANVWDGRCGGAFDTAWAMLLIMSSDMMAVVKALRR